MKVKPMLGEFSLDGLEYIESTERRALVEHRGTPPLRLTRELRIRTHRRRFVRLGDVVHRLSLLDDLHGRRRRGHSHRLRRLRHANRGGQVHRRLRRHQS